MIDLKTWLQEPLVNDPFHTLIWLYLVLCLVACIGGTVYGRLKGRR